MAHIIFNYLQKRLSPSKDGTHTQSKIHIFTRCIIDIFFQKFSDQMTETWEGGFPDMNVHMQTYQSFMWSICKCMAMKRTKSMSVQTHMTRIGTEYLIFSWKNLPLILALGTGTETAMCILSCNRYAILCSYVWLILIQPEYEQTNQEWRANQEPRLKNERRNTEKLGNEGKKTAKSPEKSAEDGWDGNMSTMKHWI